MTICGAKMTNSISARLIGPYMGPFIWGIRSICTHIIRHCSLPRAWIKPDWSTAEIMNVYKLAIKYLSDSEAYIKSMSRECDNQQKRADKLLKSIIEVGVSTTKEIDSTNKQNAAQNTKHEQELRQKKELQVKIEKNKEDLENRKF